jgi:hypothetical protein
MPTAPFTSPYTSAAPPRKSRKRWIVASAAVAAAVAVVAVIIAPPPPPPKPPTVNSEQLNSVLLSAARINAIMGASHMAAGDVVQKMADDSASVEPPDEMIANATH